MRKRLLKKAVMPRQRIKPKPAPKRSKKVKVLFVCELGQQKSVNRMISFANRLKKKGLLNLFELNTAGVLKLKPVELSNLLLEQDYIVSCTGFAVPKVRNALTGTKKSFVSLGSFDSDEALKPILETILREKGLKRPKPKKG